MAILKSFPLFFSIPTKLFGYFINSCDLNYHLVKYGRDWVVYGNVMKEILEVKYLTLEFKVVQNLF